MREMKDSGIEWIGEIPKSWIIIKLKYCAWLKGRIGWQGLRADEFTDDSTMPYLITGTDFKNGYVNWNTCAHISDERYNQDFAIHVKENDLLITKDGTVGKIAVAQDCPSKVSVNSGVFIIRNFGRYPYFDRFIYYLIQSNEFELWFELSDIGKSTIKHLTQDKFYSFSFALPNIFEQHSIADFLDRKCSEIDSLTSDIEKQIETLEQYKKSVITEAVTKGLDPDAEMKDSGVEWLHEVPESWQIMPNKYLMHKVKTICPVYNGEDILSLTMNGVIVRDLDAGGKMPTSFDGYQKVQPGNLLMCLFDIDVTPRCIGLIKQSGLTSPAYSQFNLNKNADARYYCYYYTMLDNDKTLLHLAKNLRHSLTEEQLGSVPTLVPPLNEQIKIADYLDQKLAEADSTIADKQSQLDTLAEYKKSLIYEYVTGKKEVPST